MKFLLCLLMLSTSWLYGADWRLPELHIQVLDDETGRPAAGVEVRLVRRRNFMSTFRYETQWQQTNSRGEVRVPSQSVPKPGWIGVQFRWHEQGMPSREMVWELKAKKGGKIAGDIRIRPGKQRAGYVIDPELVEGDCQNLFEASGDGEIYSIRFRKPNSYLPCEALNTKHGDLASIGSREINSTNVNFFDFNYDRKVGYNFYRELEHNPENPPLGDHRVSAYINGLIDKLVAASDMPNLKFQTTVIDADVVNAFAVPGGYIWVYRGLIEATENEAELVGVLAHEIAHVTARHGTEGMTSAISKTILGMIAAEIAAESFNEERAIVREAIGGLIMSGTNFWVIGGTRKREAEADKLGAQYAWKAGWSPNGIATLFGRFAEQRGHKQTRLDQFFSDHPNDEVRVANVSRDISFFIPPGKNLIVNSREYESIKAHLRTLPGSRRSGEAAGLALFSTFKSMNENLLMNELEGYYFDQKNKDDKP